MALPSGSQIKPDPAEPAYYSVEKTDVNQSQIQMLALGIKRSNPILSISVFNEAFGGGFSSRLFSDIRTTKAWHMRLGAALAVRGITMECCD